MSETEVSALIVPIPAADAVVSSFRTELDSGAALGVPAHITVLYPFMPASLLTDDVERDLRQVFEGFDVVEISLASIGWFGQDVVYLRPEPDVDLRRMTEVVVERWPQWPPYGGAHGDPTPHLTIGDSGDLAKMEQAAEVVGRSLPLQVEITEVHLYVGTTEPGSWHHRSTFPLRP